MGRHTLPNEGLLQLVAAVSKNKMKQSSYPSKRRASTTGDGKKQRKIFFVVIPFQTKGFYNLVNLAPPEYS